MLETSLYADYTSQFKAQMSWSFALSVHVTPIASNAVSTHPAPA